MLTKSHISAATPLTSKLILKFIIALSGALGGLTLGGCAMLYNPDDNLGIGGPQQRVYYAEYDQVWLATQKAMGDRYPIIVNNMDRGLLETGIIEGYNEKAWHPPHKSKKSRGGLRYQLKIRVIKGDIDGQSAVKVTVYKEVSLQRDFFASKKDVSSEGLEEKAILYRIQRELDLDLALRRAQEKSNANTPDFIGN